MKRAEIYKRRTSFVRDYCRFLSLKDAFEATSEKFNVSVSTLRMDWSRRDSWPKEILEDINDSSLISIYKKEICRTLTRTEIMMGTTNNDNCRLGAMKLRIETLFKLIKLQKSVDLEDVLEKVENLEKKLDEILGSGKRVREERND